VVLGDILAEAADDLWPLARQKGASFVLEGIEEPVFMMAEPHMLLRTFTNLLDNAVKYGPRAAS
jgi:signal transduction histidine kinase